MSSNLETQMLLIDNHSFKVWHASLSFSYWLVLLPIDLIFLRYFKTENFWLRNHKNLHRIFGIVIIILELISEILKYPDEESDYIKTNIKISTVIIVSILVEFSLGIIAKNNLFSDEINQYHWVISFGHRTVGYFLLFLGLNNILLMLKDISPELLIPLYVYIFLFLSFFIFLEIWWRFPNKVFKKKEVKQLIVPRITAKEVEEYIKSGKKLVLVGDKVYDVSSLVVHPGSKILIQKSVGQDISKYFYGSERLIPYFPVYRHSILAERKLEKLLFAQLHHNYVVKKPIEANLSGIHLDDRWKLIQKQKLSKNFFLLTFKSDNFLINLNPPINETNGKYFKADIDINGNIVTRYFTFILSMNRIRKLNEIKINGKSTEDSFHSLLERVTKTYKRSLFSKREREIHISEYEKGFKNEVTFCIRKIKNGASEYLINLPLGEEIIMSGPMGKPYVFSDDEKMIFLIAGAGILRFLDYFFSLYVRVCKELLGNSEVKKKIEESEDIEYLSKIANENVENSGEQSYIDLGGFGNDEIISTTSINVALSFKTLSDFIGIGLDFFYDFQRLSTYSRYVKFDFVLALTDDSKIELPKVVTGRITKDILKGMLSKNPEKIHICGPSEFKEEMFNSLIYLGIPQKGIHMI